MQIRKNMQKYDQELNQAEKIIIAPPSMAAITRCRRLLYLFKRDIIRNNFERLYYIIGANMNFIMP